MDEVGELPPHTNHCYATKHGVELWLRVFASNSAQPNAPWIVWFHGGAYCAGRHWFPRHWTHTVFREHGIHFVNVGYRLAPHVSMNEMLEDCDDAIAWCQEHLGDIVSVNPSRYAVGGESAGGGLATLVALKPGPFACVAIAGTTDLVVMQRGFDNRPPIEAPPAGKITDAIQNPDPTMAVTGPIDDSVALETRERCQVSDTEWRHGRETSLQWDVKDYLMKYRMVVRSPLRLDGLPKEEQEEILRAHSAIYNLGSSYPATVLMHGTGDVVVPVSSSQRLASALRDKGVEVLELYVPDAGHGWSKAILTKDDPAWKQWLQPIGDFVATVAGLM